MPVLLLVHSGSAATDLPAPAKLLTELSTSLGGDGEDRKNNDLARILASVTDDSEAYNL